ncbi:Fic family protein [Butyrivibrio sp. TB]|uniref:Fic family protein n=1 Tax=Butyrivibrio sp. TB TaxID=1520809 RepID=UPI0008AFDA49|nr:Fic family protein [Butyrivibrio sp. TB]SEP58419.1 Fic/DOC family protein [Butyrivibrio sp. TB]
MPESITYSDIVKAWQDKKITTVSDLESALSDYKIFFAYHSNKIEDAGVSIHQTREIFENGKVIGYTGDLRALFETENQKVCYEFLKEKVIAKEPLSGELIKSIHENLSHGCYDESRWVKGERPGTYKKNYYGVGLSVGVPPEDVEEEIDYICEALAEAGLDSIDSVLKAAVWFHCNFERIHAFADGNGRVGRTILNYILMVNDLPPAVIFDEDKETYFMALEVFDHTDKIDGFVKFIKEQTVKTWCRRTPKGKEFIAL